MKQRIINVISSVLLIGISLPLILLSVFLFKKTFHDQLYLEDFENTLEIEQNEDEPFFSVTTPPPAMIGDWLIVRNSEDLLWIMRTKDTLGASKIRFENNVDMNGELYLSIPNTIVEIDGNNKTVSNMVIRGYGFVGETNHITIQNLTLDGITVLSKKHAGALVGIIQGNANIFNCKVKNSFVTADDGAAGGLIGYIQRENEKDRSLSAFVEVESCHVENTAVSASKAEGKLVGLLNGYDSNESLTIRNCTASTAIHDYDSPYRTDNQSVFLEAFDSDVDGFLGDENYKRGTVSINGIRIIPKWDGITAVIPLFADERFDYGITNIRGSSCYVVYSPFDLAGIRKKSASPSAVYFMCDVDMNGQGKDGKFFVPPHFGTSARYSEDDNPFEPFHAISFLDGNNHTIYNLSVIKLQSQRAALILTASGNTVHKNLSFFNCNAVATHKSVSTNATANGAILVANVNATYTMENVHAKNCSVYALQKVGILAGRLSGNTAVKECSVDNCYVENYECKISERFDSGNKTVDGISVRVYTDYYPHGEVGGMFGFVQGKATINDCHVQRTTVHGYGQNDKMATIVSDYSFWIEFLGYYLVPGRHVSTFIGDIRATDSIQIIDCTVDSFSKCTNRYDKHNATFSYIGQAYYVKFLDKEGTLSIGNKRVTLADCNTDTVR